MDQYGKKDIVPARERYTNVYEKYLEVQNKIKELSKTEQQMAHRLDLLQFQIQEIEKANLKMNEDDLLEEERKRLVNFEKLFGSLKDGYEQLQGDQRGLDSIGRAMSMLETAAEVDSKYQSIKESVSNSYYMLEDAVSTIRTELDMLEYDPMRLNEIESRLNEINQLKRKYGYTVEQILDYYEKIKEETESILNKESRLEELQKQLDKLKKQLIDIGNHLTKIRKKWANKLTNAIHRELKELYMDKTVFEVTFNEQLPSGNGLDNIQFYISTNPGEPLKPLSKVASGGELSRIMLALKTIFSTRVTSVIFDEVDTGVSGRVAQAMAEKMYKISVNSQVLCISHLPQVAAMADHHMLIAKEIINKRTRTTIKNLTEKEKIKEIGRMISGTEITDITKRHAKELLQSAYTIKKS